MHLSFLVVNSIFILFLVFNIYTDVTFVSLWQRRHAYYASI